MAIDSPCTRVCAIDPMSGLCRGCLRTIDEIAGWGSFPPAIRQAIMATLPGRAPQAVPAPPEPEGRRGARATRSKRREPTGTHDAS
ncbi:DUF1289 domain-containing protein [Jiella sp. MQZ9-1]|uniref:DUF1289 domain-containing protein n=1 Tax=Jiella flava TaxID=2816857 RepID=A0A939FWL9_9HYPH|nr:DUF1289 domain-containing protein [Jiella flava]MBO0662101.1 DUF1289 domain-containing protein [Jiella flava]MCD2470571.1 DUF1289 domain-containing protein [Jiella flava]